MSLLEQNNDERYKCNKPQLKLQPLPEKQEFVKYEVPIEDAEVDEKGRLSRTFNKFHQPPSNRVSR